MLDSQKIVIDLGSVRLDLYFGDEEQSQVTEIHPVVPMTRSSFAFGVMNYSRADLERFKSRNEKVKVRVLGGFRLDKDISPALAVDVVDSIRVFGLLQAQDDVKNALMQTGKIL